MYILAFSVAAVRKPQAKKSELTAGELVTEIGAVGMSVAQHGGADALTVATVSSQFVRQSFAVCMRHTHTLYSKLHDTFTINPVCYV